MKISKRSAAVALVAPLMVLVASCQQPPPPPPPLPPLTESCKFTNTPVVFVPSDRVVERISAGRRGTEPSLVSVAVRIGEDFRQDGTMYVPGPDLGYHPYLINHPEYFAQSGDNNARKRVTASMLWSSAGSLLRSGARVLNALFRHRWRHDSILYGARFATAHGRKVRFFFSDPTTASAAATARPTGTG